MVKAFLKSMVAVLSLYFCTMVHGEESAQEFSTNCRLAEAQKMIADVIPGESAQAEKILINCIRINPKSLEPILELAKFMEQQVSTGEKPVRYIYKSVALVSQAYTLAPDDPKVRFTMAHMLNTIGQYEESQSLYDKTMEKFPDSKEVLVEKARLIVKDNPDEALKLIDTSVKMGTNVDEVLDVIFSCVRFKNQGNSYSQSLSSLADKFQNRWLFHKLGALYLEEKKYTESAKAFTRAIELGNTIESRLQLAVLQYQYLNDNRSSIKNFEDLIKEVEKKKYIPSSSQALIYAHYSLALYSNHKIEEASKAALLVAKKSFEKRDYIRALVSEYKSRNALYVLQPTLELVTLNDPTFDLAYVFLGEIYNESKNYPKALEVLDKAIILSQKDD